MRAIVAIGKINLHLAVGLDMQGRRDERTREERQILATVSCGGGGCA